MVSTDESDSNEDPRRKSRKKIDILWEKAVAESGGTFAITERRFTALFKDLTKMEVKVCVCLAESWSSAKIGTVLGRDEHTINNHITEIRKKLNLPHPEKLPSFFASH